MKILITGAHFTPAQAVIEKLLSVPDLEIVYLGRQYARDDDKAVSVESKILPGLGVKFIPIIAGKLNRFFSLGTIISFLKTPVGFVQSFYYLLKEQPDLIVSFGGFTGMPVVVCGWFLSIPSLVHEQGLRLGLANLISSFFADKVAVSLENTKIPEYLNKNKFVITGNPIRKEFLNPLNPPTKDVKDIVKKSSKPLVLITAGNQGSHFINLLVEDKLLELTKETNLIHQTGDSKYDDFSNLQKHQSASYLVKKWIDPEDLSFILDNADLVVSRAGINTLSELALKEAPVLIVPIPVGKEQKENARFFSKNGLGEVITEDKLNPEIFIGKIKDLLDRRKGLKTMARKTKTLIILDADKRLVQEILVMLNSVLNYDLGFK